MKNIRGHQPLALLTVDGEIERARSFTMAELRRIGAQLFDSRGRGIAAAPMTAVVDLLRVKIWARYAVVHGADGFVANIPLAHLHQCSLAYAVDERALPVELGGPLRLLAPGLGRCTSVKGVTRITVSEFAELFDGRCNCVHSASVFPPSKIA